MIHRSAREHAHVGEIYVALNIDFSRVAKDFFKRVKSATEEKPELRINTFSDFVVASCTATPVGLALLTFFAWTLSSDWLSRKYLCRGAITKGAVLHRDGRDGALRNRSTSLVFGPAFVEAYQLEHEVADLPRIVLSQRVRKDWKIARQDASLAEYGKLVHVCEDGPTCVDAFAHLRSNGFVAMGGDNHDQARLMKEALLGHLEDAADTPRHYKKTHWLAKRFNESLEGTPYVVHKVVSA